MSSLLSLLLESKVLQCGKVLVRKTAGEAEEWNSTKGRSTSYGGGRGLAAGERPPGRVPRLQG